MQMPIPLFGVREEDELGDEARALKTGQACDQVPTSVLSQVLDGSPPIS